MSIEIYSTKLAKEIASDLLEIGAIKLNSKNPFTWASGWKSPIYCDNRLSLSFPSVRNKIKIALSLGITQTFGAVDSIAGVATAGIPQGVLVAQELGLPFCYVRSKSKGHGLENMIEGEVKADQKVLVIEDLISTGGSSLAAVNALKNVGADVIGMASIFTYGFPISEENFAKAGIDAMTLSDYNHLIEIVSDKKQFSEETIQTLKKWRTSPESWEG